MESKCTVIIVFRSTYLPVENRGKYLHGFYKQVKGLLGKFLEAEGLINGKNTFVHSLHSWAFLTSAYSICYLLNKNHKKRQYDTFKNINLRWACVFDGIDLEQKTMTA